MFLLLLQLVTLSCAFHWNGPAETTGKWFSHDSSAKAPEPTTPPKADLKRRQEPGDSTCGFYNASSSGAYYCLDGTANVCATDSNFGWGCCHRTELDYNCAFGTACIDSTALSNFHSAYLATANVWICQESTAAYCTTDYLQANGNEYTGYGCFSFSYSDTYYATYLNGTTPGTFTATYFNGYYSASAPLPITSPPSSSTLSPLPPTPIPMPHSHVGAIVGGVVGGIGLIAVVGLVAFCIFRRKRKQKRQTETIPYNSEQQMRGGPSAPMTQHQPTQDWNYQHSNAQSAYPMVESPKKQTFTGHTSQVTSPTSVSSGPLSYTSDGKHEEQSMLSAQYPAIDDSQMRRDGDIPELDGRNYGAGGRY